MKRTKLLLITLALGLSASALNAQDVGGRQRRSESQPPREGGRPARPEAQERGLALPIVAALDLNGDRIIDAAELARATESLKKLDRNGDGKLTMDELRPARPEGGPGVKRDSQRRPDVQRKRERRPGDQAPPEARRERETRRQQ